MKKKNLILLFLTMIMTLSLVACGGKKEDLKGKRQILERMVF